ncbi:MAG: GNAT family N-acetyltransferase [Rhizomicrobium sp.]|nr:GNAT family N-acetyltransferase [Rhizomicrobium sp.]
MPITDLNIPVLDTPRLILRAHRREDFETMVSIWQDPAVTRHFHGVSLSREDIWGRFLRGFGMWVVNGYGLWAVEDKATGDYAGTVGAFEVKREITPPVGDMPEAGWTFAARFHGKGYATEAMQAALRWTDSALAGRAMFCIVAPENTPSIRVAQKCGFKPWFETTYHEAPTLAFKREPFTTP